MERSSDHGGEPALLVEQQPARVRRGTRRVTAMVLAALALYGAQQVLAALPAAGAFLQPFRPPAVSAPATAALTPVEAIRAPAVVAQEPGQKYPPVEGTMPLPIGSLVALATPMTDDGKVDIPTLRNLLRWHKEEGTNGVVILGTTGEASTLSNEEKIEVMVATREEIGGKIPIIVGTGTISTEATIASTKQAKLFGADAALVVTPYYVKPSQAGLLNHFTQIADSVDLPLILYNVPGRTGVDLSDETACRLALHPMIRGLKDATGDNTRVAKMRAICGDDFRLYSGEDAMARDYVLQGGDGAISVTANVAPAAVASVMAKAKAGDTQAAETADAPLQALHRDLFSEANPIPVKWALAKMGKMPAGIRSPLWPLGGEFQIRVEQALQQAQVIDAPEGAKGSIGWASKVFRISGQLFDQGLINQALDTIEKRGGDFDIMNVQSQPNDLTDQFNYKRKSSATIRVYAVNGDALDDITARLKTLCQVLEKAEGSITEVK